MSGLGKCKLSTWIFSMLSADGDLTTKGMPTTTCIDHLDGIFTTELPTKEGSSHPLHKAVVTAPYLAGGSMTCRRATKPLQGVAQPNYNYSSLKNKTQGINTLLSLGIT